LAIKFFPCAWVSVILGFGRRRIGREGAATPFLGSLKFDNGRVDLNQVSAKHDDSTSIRNPWRSSSRRRSGQLFGQDGFEKMVARVAQLEQQTGIYDLNQFTPAVSASQATSR